MPHRANRLLHVLASVPVTALLAASLALPVHARVTLAPAVTAPAERPAQIVVAVDPGHGGKPDNNHPEQPFDPGVVAPNGLLEKDITLDVAGRVRSLLEADRVKVVLTRTSDTFVTITDRMDQANRAGAALFVSIHFNSFNDSGTSGDLVLYPDGDSLPFATTMSAALDRGLGPLGETDNGIQLKSDLWVHASMPAVTVEGGFLTNADDAQRLSADSYRDTLAHAITTGVEAQQPLIAQRKAEIAAWDAAHPGSVPSEAAGNAAGSASGSAAGGGDGSGSLGSRVLHWAELALVLGLCWKLRRQLVHGLAVLITWVYRTATGTAPPPPRATGAHRSRRQATLERARQRGTVEPRRRGGTTVRSAREAHRAGRR